MVSACNARDLSRLMPGAHCTGLIVCVQDTRVLLRCLANCVLVLAHVLFMYLTCSVAAIRVLKIIAIYSSRILTICGSIN